MSTLDFVIAALATYRLTRLVTTDRITERLRAWAESRSALAGYLSTCAWCSSIWLGAPVAAAATLAPDAWAVRATLTALALSAVAGLIDLIEGNLDKWS